MKTSWLVPMFIQTQDTGMGSMVIR